jgi:hypothetical protein
MKKIDVGDLPPEHLKEYYSNAAESGFSLIFWEPW